MLRNHADRADPGAKELALIVGASERMSSVIENVRRRSRSTLSCPGPLDPRNR